MSAEKPTDSLVYINTTVAIFAGYFLFLEGRSESGEDTIVFLTFVVAIWGISFILSGLIKAACVLGAVFGGLTIMDPEYADFVSGASTATRLYGAIACEIAPKELYTDFFCEPIQRYDSEKGLIK